MTDSNDGGGVVKAGTTVATNILDALRSTPMLLVLTVLNVLMFAMMTYLIMQSAQFRFKERSEIIQMLSRCIEEAHRNNTSYQSKWLKGVQPQTVNGSGK